MWVNRYRRVGWVGSVASLGRTEVHIRLRRENLKERDNFQNQA